MAERRRRPAGVPPGRTTRPGETATTTAAAQRARRSAGAASRERILDVAEAHFAQYGVDGVSLRAVNAEAGFGPAAVNYHFGGRDELLLAVLQRRDPLVIARQLALLAEVEDITEPTTPQLVRVIATPFFELLAQEPVGGRHWLRIVTQLAQANDPRVTRRGRPEPLEERLMEQLLRRYPQHTAEYLEPRWRLAILALMALLAASGAEFDADLAIRFIARGFDGVCEP